MRIIFNEIKKVFNVKIIVLIMFISLIIYYLFISFNFRYFPNGRPNKDEYNISVQMLKDYGTSMDKKEFLNFKELYNKQLEQADKYLKSKPEFVKSGMTTYKKLNSINMDNKKLSKLYDKVFFEDEVDMFWELQVRSEIIAEYENINRYVSSLSKNQLERYHETIKNSSITSIFPEFVFRNYNELINNVAMLIVLSIIIMVSPIFIKDSRNKVNYLQYTSNIGRKIFKTKLITALISSFIIISVQLIGFFILYSHNKVGMFFNTSINSVFSFNTSWYNISFIQYIVLTVVGIYIVGFAVTLIVTFISRLAPNYITLIGVQIPITFVILNISSNYLLNSLTSTRFPKYLQPIAYSSLVCIGLILIIFRWNKEKIIDIVN
ncbi:hypothetical protein LL033_17610 [Clostridium estertheticum]|uniref:hypothetical protein n=1 Tax=Clostridium estertheticum TaxID=238834 RepID=UPI001C0AB6AF|nr:hypothetical protein [Clostridium estertheticum]MBU3216614.1 hypothetical protein [Clostridium estertheticum]WAG54431.1 hypothetical protein LL033_17610 [Clostridium estertheticum]